MNTLLLPSTDKTEAQNAFDSFREQFVRLCDTLLNRLFDLRPNRAVRLSYLLLLFFFAWFLTSTRIYPFTLWAQHLQEIFLYLFSLDYSKNYVGNPFIRFFDFGWEAFTSPNTLQYLPILLLPFFIAWQCAAVYVADIFELEDVSIARKFIRQVTLTGNKETVRIKGGALAEEYSQSPIFTIGGPGKVIVDIDSVALFEKPDCTPHVIGPTANQPKGKATLDGFERLRHTIDLRDHHSESLTVSGRSLDGIKISATDIKLVYSIFRDHKNQDFTKERPYPYTDEVVKDLAYGFTSKVTDQYRPANSVSSPNFFGIANILPIVRGELGSLISEHKLTEFVASIGLPEFEKALAREMAIEKDVKKVNPPDEDIPPTPTIPPFPDFISRQKITDLFSEIEEKFVQKCRERGVELPWIGVGTWKTPVEIVPEKHLEAWKLSRENLNRGSDAAMKDFENETTQQKMMVLIQDVPLGAYQKATSEEKEHKNALKLLLLAYRQQIIEAKDLILAKGETVPSIIEAAIKHINKIFGHFI